MNFLKKSVINASGSFLLGVINLFIGIVLARKLGPEGIGQYQLVITTATIVAALATFGVGMSVVYYINNKKEDITEVASLAFKFSLPMGIIAFCTLWPILTLEEYFGQMFSWVSVMIAVYGALLVIVTVVWPILIANLQVVKYQFVAILPRLILLLLVLFAMGVGTLNINTAWFFTAFGQISAVVIVIWFLRKNLNLKVPVNPGLLKSLIGYGLKMNLSYIVFILNGEIALFLIRALLPNGFSQIGYYSRALRVGGLLLLCGQSIGPMLYAKWSASKGLEKTLQVERLSRVFLSLSVVGVALLILFSRQIVFLLYGEQFLPAVVVLKFLLVGVGARFLYMPIFRLFSASGKPLYTSFVLILNLIVMSILMFFLIPAQNASGAAISFSLANLIGLIATYYISHIKFGIRLNHCLFITWADLKYLYRALKF